MKRASLKSKKKIFMTRFVFPFITFLIIVGIAILMFGCSKSMGSPALQQNTIMHSRFEILETFKPFADEEVRKDNSFITSGISGEGKLIRDKVSHECFYLLWAGSDTISGGPKIIMTKAMCPAGVNVK